MKPVFFALIILLLILVGPAGSHAQPGDQDITVRICIANDLNFITLYIKDPYTIYASGSEKILTEGARIATKVISAKDGLLIRDKHYSVSAIRIKTGKESRIYIDKKLFRGDVDILKKPNGRLLVINRVGLEEYLYGVLYHEVSHRWPMEVLKAQAIVARTFALYQMAQNASGPYDLRNDIYSQVYGGSDFERWSTTTAVNKTKGMVLIYKGDLLPAYYHAACSGGTEEASALWKSDLPPLHSVTCDFCRESPYYRWVKDIPLSMLEGKLKQGGHKIGQISAVTIVSKNSSGRVNELEIKDAAGAFVVLSGKDFRQLMGPNEVRSTKFDASVRQGQLLLEGRGWGHGVGMCQWGAFGQAKQGKKAEEILKYYYPGAEIVKMESLK